MDSAKLEELKKQMQDLAPGRKPERKFFEGLEQALTPEQKTRLAAIQARAEKGNIDVNLRPIHVLRSTSAMRVRSRPSSESTSTTTRSTPCPRRARSTGASSGTASASCSPSDPRRRYDCVTWLNRSKYCCSSSSEKFLYSNRFAVAGSSGGNSRGLLDSVS